ncbi:MAG TPA: hypothetical protein VGO47_09700 [Chlamydiales bacterium]|nr:hypothetical protein [Chlamydiales bacterium]
MVEFGAGGQLVHNEDPVTLAAEYPPAGEGQAGESSGAAGNGDDTQNGQPSTPAPIPAPSRSRRKRKPKGWFCPVCRQPYTSLLRISTTVPAKDDKPVSAGVGDAPGVNGAPTTPQSPGTQRRGMLAALTSVVRGDGGNGNGRATPRGEEAV